MSRDLLRTSNQGLHLELDQVSLTYQSGTPFAHEALHEVSLTVEPGERLAIAGPVGSGKSTLLSILAGVEPLTSGGVRHDGREITAKQTPPPGSIGLAFQAPENCLFEKTVRDDVSFAPRTLGLSEQEVKSRTEDAMQVTGLDPSRFGKRNPFSLSSGEQRRAALAGVLAMKPKALLLDEPTAYLDPATRRELMARLVGLNRETGVTMVMVGHDMDELASFASRVIIIDEGHKVADGPAATILTDIKLLTGHSLVPPGTVELCRQLAVATGTAIEPVLDEGEAIEIMRKMMPCR